MKKRFLCCLIIATILILNTAVYIVTPAFARSDNKAVWSVELLPIQEQTEPYSNILTKDNVRVLMRELQDIPINIYGAEHNINQFSIEKSNNISAEIKHSDNGYTLSFIDDAIDGAGVTLIWSDGIHTLSARFILYSDNLTASSNGLGFEVLSTQFNKLLPIRVKTNEESIELRLNYGEFPPMTRYVIDSSETLLYDGGFVTIPKAKECAIDISKTNIDNKDISLSSGSCMFNVPYAPILNNEVNRPYIIDNTIKELPIFYKWKEIEPEIEIMRLSKNDDNILSWRTADVKCAAGESGNIYVNTDGVPPGTYKININWIQNGVSLYNIETEFYICFDGIAKGGTAK